MIRVEASPGIEVVEQKSSAEHASITVTNIDLLVLIHIISLSLQCRLECRAWTESWLAAPNVLGRPPPPARRRQYQGVGQQHLFGSALNYFSRSLLQPAPYFNVHHVCIWSHGLSNSNIGAIRVCSTWKWSNGCGVPVTSTIHGRRVTKPSCFLNFRNGCGYGSVARGDNDPVGHLLRKGGRMLNSRLDDSRFT